MKILQINSVLNTGSTGHIAEDIGRLIIQHNWTSYIAYGRKAFPSTSNVIRIGTKIGILYHVGMTRIFDNHGLLSVIATLNFINKINKIKPDIIHLHNIHGYYLNYKILFKYLAKSGIPVVWTMHDCWALTGHCSYYTFVKCEQWQTAEGCKRCSQKRSYPKSIIFSNATRNFKNKKKYFNLLQERQLTIVAPSQWLCNEVTKSYLGHYRHIVINNGIDLSIFKPILSKNVFFAKKVVLGVASVWDERKGLDDFIKLSFLLEDDEEILLVGLSDKQIKTLPKDRNIRGLSRTENQQQLAELYSNSVVFVNPTYEDTFPTTNIESLACGTPVITYNTGGSPEIIDGKTGFVVDRGNINKIYECIKTIMKEGREKYINNCVERTRCFFNKENNFEKYISLYQEINNAKV